MDIRPLDQAAGLRRLMQGQDNKNTLHCLISALHSQTIQNFLIKQMTQYLSSLSYGGRLHTKKFVLVMLDAIEGGDTQDSIKEKNSLFRLQINDQFVDKLNVLAQQYHVLLCLNSTEQFAYLQAHIAQTRFTQFRFLLQTSDTIDSIKTSYQTLKAHAATLQLSTVHILIHSSDIRVAHQVYQNLEDAAKQYLNLSLQYAGSFTLQTEQTTNSIDVSIQRIMYNWLENCESSAMLDNASSHFHLMPV